MTPIKYIIVIGASLFLIGYIVKSIIALVRNRSGTKKGDNKQ